MVNSPFGGVPRQFVDGAHVKIGRVQDLPRASGHSSATPLSSGSGSGRADLPRLSFSVEPAAVLRVGFVLVVLFDIASLTGQYLEDGLELGGAIVDHFVRLTDVNGEGSVPTWFQSSCLLACSALLWTVGRTSRERGLRRHGAWRLVSAAFLYLSIDEASALHEGVNRPVREALDLDGPLYFAWVVVAVPLVLAFGLVLLPWLRDLPRRTRVAFLASGAVYVSGTVGLELVGAVLWQSVGRESLVYAVATTVEETLEMTGMLLFLAAVAAYHRSDAVRAVVPDGYGGVESTVQR